MTLALALAGLEAYLGRTAPDPAVKARREAGRNPAKLGDKWSVLVHRASAVEGLAYELNPGYAGSYKTKDGKFAIRVNAEGLRDDDTRPEKSARSLRIAVLGDSTTFGYGVEADETYSKLLEERLNAAGTGWEYEVLNFGTSGYNTLDEAITLRAKALAYDPDFVILGYNLNDPDLERIQPLHRLFAKLPWWQDTHLWQKLDSAGFRRRIARYPSVFDYAHDPERENWTCVVDGFRSIAETAGARDLKVLVAIFPSGLARDDYAFAALHEQVAAEARRQGLDVLDLLSVYAELERAGEAYLLKDMHPNPRGHEAAADALGQWVLTHHAQIFAGRAIQ